MWRQLFQFLNIASAQDDVVGLKRRDQARNHIRYIATPLLLASFFESLAAHVVLVRAFFVREMAKFHGFHDAIHHQRGTEAGAEAQEEHFAVFVTSQSLHGCIISDFNRAPECNFKIKPDPPGRQVMRVGDRPVLQNRAGISHRDGVIFPRSRESFDAGDHLLWRHFWPRGKLPRRVLSGDKDLHVSSAHINHQHLHEEVL